jgi:hypothetical protein
MTTAQKILGLFTAFVFGAVVPVVSVPLIDRCTPIGDANFWLPFGSISCPVELLGQVGCFIVGFVFTVVFIMVMVIQLLVLGISQKFGIVSLDFIGSIGNSVLIIPLLVGLSANTIVYWIIIRFLFSVAKSRKTKSTEM